MTQVYDGRICIGSVICHRGAVEARDAQGERIGTFDHESAAVNRLKEHMRKREARQ